MGLEFGLLFFVVPMLMALRRDPSFERRSVFCTALLRGELRKLPIRCAGIAVLMAAGVGWLAPGLLHSFPRRSPLVWSVVMVLYPVLSVVPQELLFRAFLLHRYRRLFPGALAALLASAAAFGFAHVLFGNWVSVALSCLGGLLFTRTYLRTGSFWLVSLEHAVLGDVIFTIGLGQFFYPAARG